MNRTSVIQKTDMGGDEFMYTVHMYEDSKLIESRTLPNHSIHYANDVAENWENGIIKKRKQRA